MAEFSIQDLALLREMQRDGSLPLAALAERCGMAQSTVWRRVQEFEASGLIRGRVALLDPALAGCKLTVLASISLTSHADATVRGFTSIVASHPEIVECFSVSGASDFQLKIRVRDVEAYEVFMTQVLLRSDHVREVHSSFVLRELKATTALPL